MEFSNPTKTRHIHNLLNPARPEPDYSGPDPTRRVRVWFGSGCRALMYNTL